MELGHPRRRRQGGLGALLVIIVASCLCNMPAWAAGPKFFFNIPAGDALKTLATYYTQSKIEMLYLTDNVRGAKTNAVSGNLEASEALDIMLKGTGLEYSFKEDFSFVSINPAVVVPQGSAEPPIEVITAAAQMASRDTNEFARYVYGTEQNLDEVVITGTQIRGVTDIMSPLEFVTRKELRRTAYATVQDGLQALPFAMGGGPSEDFGSSGNFARGSGVNLRGLGAGATLVLVNGNRQPYSGTEADFTDVSTIPWSAIDHIEVLPDGASAQYGSDAIAGVVNVIMRKDFDGSETLMRFGTAPGGGEEKLFSQLFGKSWQSGNFLLSYQLSERTALPAGSRRYAASSDKRSLGGSDHRTYFSNPGNIIDPATFLPVFAIPSNQPGTSLTVNDLLASTINLEDTFAHVELLPDRNAHSLFFSGSQQLGSGLELFAEGRYGARYSQLDYLPFDLPLVVPSTNAFYVNPFPETPFVVVAYNFLDDVGPVSFVVDTRSLSGTFGAKATLSDSWKLKISGSYGEESLDYRGEGQIDMGALELALADSNPETAFNPFGDGSQTNPATLNAIRGVARIQSQSAVTSATVIADGTMFALPTGEAKLAIGGELRREQVIRSGRTRVSFDRTIGSAFAELAVPLVGSTDDAKAVPRLELSLAGRYESYSDFGSTANPKIGLRWAPLNSLKLRSSWGTSFRAPKLRDIYDSSINVKSLVLLPDGRSATGSSIVLADEGSNPDLEEETASTWTAGLDFAPPMIEGLTASLTYYSINYDNRILVPGVPSQLTILLKEEQWASVITRNPTQSQISAACESPFYRGSADECKSTPVAAIVDFRVRNLAKTRVRGVDLKIDHSLRTKRGRFGFGLDGGYIFDFREAASDASPMNDVVNSFGNPLAFRLRGTAEWHQRDWGQPGLGVSLVVDHFNGYSTTKAVAETARHVDSLSTVDLQFSYRTAPGDGAFDDVEIGLNGVNLFNTSPPFVDNETGYDAANADPYGRVVSLSMQKSW